jgi:allantoin racemase
MQIGVITPLVTEGFRPADDLISLGSPTVTISHQYLELGPASIESDFDDVLAGPGTVASAIQAYKDGADAVVVDCFGDIAVGASREAIPIPVVGPGEVSMHLACQLGHRYSVIAVLDRVIRRIENRARLYGVADRLVSVRSVDAPVLELHDDPDDLADRLARESLTAVREDGAHVIILGCTGMSSAARAVSQHLQAAGYDVPVIEPLSAAVRFAEGLVRLGLTASPLSYPPPPHKRIKGYPAVLESAAAPDQTALVG